MVQSSGSIDLTNATFNSDVGADGFNGVSFSSIFLSPNTGVREAYLGVRLYSENFINDFVNSSGTNGSGGFELSNNTISVFSDGDAAIIDDGAGNATTYSPSRGIFIRNVDFTDFNFGNVPRNTPIDLWAVSATSDDDEKVQFVVVPEPSSAILTALGSSFFLRRRRR